MSGSAPDTVPHPCPRPLQAFSCCSSGMGSSPRQLLTFQRKAGSLLLSWVPFPEPRPVCEFVDISAPGSQPSHAESQGVRGRQGRGGEMRQGRRSGGGGIALTGTCEPRLSGWLLTPHSPGAPRSHPQHCRQVSAVLVFTGRMQTASRGSLSSWVAGVSPCPPEKW